MIAKATNKKTGNIYNVIGVVTDATNGFEGRDMVLYERGGVRYVRELGEFCEKFIIVPEVDNG